MNFSELNLGEKELDDPKGFSAANFLGVLGGMGPLATADFLRKLVEKTPAGCDQEHIPVLLYGDC